VALNDGQLVAIPTETVYGLAGNGFNETAIQNIFKVKNRPFYDPLILHTNSLEKWSDWGLEIPEVLMPLARDFWPGPLTLLLNRSLQIPDIITAGLDRVAVRIPNHRLTLDLLARLDYPLAAPSANPFGYVSPTAPNHVAKHFQGKISMVLDGGTCSVGIESTIVGLKDGLPTIYRLGGISMEQIEALIGKVALKTSSSQPSAPGMLTKHYAPNKNIVTVETKKELNAVNPSGVAYILYNLDLKAKQGRMIKLSKTGEDKEAAQKFYEALRHWDEDEVVKTLVIERLPNFGLGRAVNDRLMRAAAK